MADDYSNNSDQPQDPGPYWQDQIQYARKYFETWEQRGEKVVARYRDERDAVERQKTKFNILWSNVQVLTPSLYGRPAKPEVSRRYMDSDPVGRLASTMLERVLDYETQQFPDYDDAMEGCVEDRLLSGRGTAWMRFEPVIVADELKAPADIQITNKEPIKMERIDAAHAPVDYVYWKDFLHSPARTWSEVWWVGRRVYMTREEGVKRFGEVFNNVPLSAQDTDDDDRKKRSKGVVKANAMQKAEVWEIWDKRKANVCWIAKDYRMALEEKPDPLQLEGFFPCPKPLYATTTTGSLVPVPDYVEYQDQAEELDKVNARISAIVKAVKAVGVFNGEFKELNRMLLEGIDNKLFPVSNWGALSEKGGLKGAIDMLDITPLVQALGVLYKAREDIKQTIYEVCGISDILRGATEASETLGAQQLKANFGSLRLRSSQTDVARFASDLFKLKAEIICRFYPDELIVQMSGIMRTSEDPQNIPSALQLLKNSTIRDWAITVESDSLAQIDEEQEKQAATEAITATTAFIAQAGPVIAQAPELLPAFGEMWMYLVRSFKGGRPIESAIERGIQGLQQKAAQMQMNPPPSPEEIKAKAQAQSDQFRAEMDIQRSQLQAQFDAQVQQGKLQQEAQLEALKASQAKEVARMEGQIKMLELSAEERMEKYKADLQAEVDLTIAQMQAESARQGAQMQAETARQSAEAGTEQAKIKSGLAPKEFKVADMMTKIDSVIQSLNQPKPLTRRRVERDASGRIAAVVNEPVESNG